MTRRELIDELKDIDCTIADLELELENLIYHAADDEITDKYYVKIRELEEKYQSIKKELD